MWRHTVILFAMSRLLAISAEALEEKNIDQLLAEAAKISAQLPEPSATVNSKVAAMMAHYHAKRHKECLEVARDVIRANPNHTMARFIAASALIEMNRYDAAQKLLEQMLERYPNHPGLLNNLAWLYATATDPAYRRPQEALELARRALVLEPSNFHIWSTVAEAYYVNRDYRRALRAAEEALNMARARNLDARQIVSYEKQVEKCNAAVAAFSIFD